MKSPFRHLRSDLFSHISLCTYALFFLSVMLPPSALALKQSKQRSGKCPRALSAPEQNILVVVNPSSTGKYMEGGIRHTETNGSKENNFYSVAVITRPSPSWVFDGLNLDGFDRVYDMDDYLSYYHLAEAMKADLGSKTGKGGLNIKIVPGTQTAIEAHTKLGDLLNTGQQNQPETLPFLLSKGRATEALGKKNIRVPKQVEATEESEMLRFLENTPGPWVIKPPNSSGGDQVVKAYTVKDALVAFRNSIRQMNADRNINHSLLVQEFLRGKEYAPNGIMVNGVPKFTEIIAYDRVEVMGAGNLYKSITVLDPNSLEHKEIIAKLIPYTKRVLEALGFKNGAFHPEIILDPEKGPALVEFNGRMAGGSGLPYFISRATGVPIMELLAKSLYRPRSFLEHPEMYSLQSQVAAFLIRCPKEGLMMRPDLEPFLKNTLGKALMKIIPYVDLNKPLVKSIDLDTTPVLVVLKARDAKRMTRILDSLESIQTSGGFFSST